MQSLLAEMDTNTLRLLREELSACFSALLRLLLIILGKSPSCSSYIYTEINSRLCILLAMLRNGLFRKRSLTISLPLV